MGVMADYSTQAYVGWEEVAVACEKGRREVHYYLKRSGGRDLVVVGKEKTLRHMSYRYAVKDKRLLHSIFKRCYRMKLRSRREVIDCLNSILSGERPNGSSGQFGGGVDNNLDADTNMDGHVTNCGNGTTWVGSSWTCRKRRQHYQSFSRNGAVVSVQDFVYVLAEEGNRLIAYLDDMYEDTRGNKMVVVRWFHKIDEVGFILPHDYNDREIFFSLCLQDLSIECIDGLATVLSPEHFEKFVDEATGMGLVPFVCCRQFDNDDVKPFDVTQVKGYWKQEFLRKKFLWVDSSENHWRSKGYLGDNIGIRPNKRIRWSEECDIYYLNSTEDKVNSENYCGSSLDSKVGVQVGSLKGGCSNESLPGLENKTPQKSQYLNVGSHVEVLSQDSGIRGCWFRGLIIKKHKDKIKVRYEDLKDALDDSKHLEEWILASRIAAHDALGIRLSGRTMIRPTMAADWDKVSCSVSVGSMVDAWWNDGWWEGIVVDKQSDARITVNFPGENRELKFKFSTSDLRPSLEWFDNGWHSLTERPDLALSLYRSRKAPPIDPDGAQYDHQDTATPIQNPRKVIKIRDRGVDCHEKQPTETSPVRDLAKDSLLAQLSWRSSGKRCRRHRRCGRSPTHKDCHDPNAATQEFGLQTFTKFFINSSLKLDPDHCKYASDPRFGSSVVPRLTNLVMSR